LVEDVMLVAWRRIDSIPRDAEQAWLIGVARNVLANARRAQNRRTDFVSSWPVVETTASAEDSALADLAVREALQALAEADREILLLHFWDGLGAGQLATVLSISTNAAAVRLSRALARFKDHFGVVQKT
jgi:RNA polymerase sigma-70 factor (ECF subfamily)